MVIKSTAEQLSFLKIISSGGEHSTLVRAGTKRQRILSRFVRKEENTTMFLPLLAPMVWLLSESYLSFFFFLLIFPLFVCSPLLPATNVIILEAKRRALNDGVMRTHKRVSTWFLTMRTLLCFAYITL